MLNENERKLLSELYEQMITLEKDTMQTTPLTGWMRIVHKVLNPSNKPYIILWANYGTETMSFDVRPVLEALLDQQDEIVISARTFEVKDHPLEPNYLFAAYVHHGRIKGFMKGPGEIFKL